MSAPTRVLWIVNIVLPAVAEDLGLNKTPFGGWLTLMTDRLALRDDFRIGVAMRAPVKTLTRIEKNGIVYYAMPQSASDAFDVDDGTVAEVLADFVPDVLHAEGSEMAYTRRFLSELDQAICPWLGDLYQSYPDIRGGSHYWSLSWVPTSMRKELKGQINDDMKLLSAGKRLLASMTQSVPETVASADSSEDSRFATLAWLVADESLDTLEIGRAIVRYSPDESEHKLVILAFGSMCEPGLEAGRALGATVVDMRWVKPIDAELLQRFAEQRYSFVTVEEGCIMGGAGSAVTEHLHAQGFNNAVLQLGLPDEFIDHGDPVLLLKNLGLDAQGIETSIKQHYGELFDRHTNVVRHVAGRAANT